MCVCVCVGKGGGGGDMEKRDRENNREKRQAEAEQVGAFLLFGLKSFLRRKIRGCISRSVVKGHAIGAESI